MPALAVVVPVAERDWALLPGLLACLQAQTYPLTEIILALAQPDLVAGPPLPVRMIANPSRAIAAGLNLAIRSTTCDYIVRLDARARPGPGYVAQCMTALLNRPGVYLVGGRLMIEPGGPGTAAAALAVAVGHPLGAGDARYRVGGAAGPVDTVPYPCFRRDVWERAGGYNESLEANEDYEFNWRVRRAGGTVWFDPSIACGYVARHTYAALAAQYFRYGWWKMQMLKRHPRSIRWRQAAPLAASGCVAALTLGATASSALALGLAIVVELYAAVLLVASVLAAARQRRPAFALLLPPAFALIHIAWAGGAWLNLLTGGRWPRPH